VATVEECEQALTDLADRLAANDSAQRSVSFDRTLTCAIRDLDVIFAGRLKDGHLVDIHRTPSKDAQVRLSMSSDDLVDLVAGRLKMASAWASGRVRIDASIRDMLRLRSLF
jgi:alkyl sulfatase BDS1-like metallo-beta-lactamase superfamily hydrolase